ncbi:MAG TPA: DNA-3-methyladenine glycosylase [Cyclobacteriaceae bacterium]|nr:DNA-3-methyladenine glycosylase [Cyclobacteriaceae bacterium]
MNSFTISLPQEFNFDHCLSHLKRSPLELLHQCVNEEVFKSIRIENEIVLIKISSIQKSALHLEVLNTSLTTEMRVAITAYINDWFDLDKDLKPFYAMAARNRILKPLVEKFYGYRIVGQPDLFESLIWAVIGQQINLQFAYTMKSRLVKQFGENMKLNGMTHYLFPQPKTIARLGHEDLLPLQFSRQKSTYSIGIAEAFESGQLSKEKLQSLSLEDARAELMKIKGVGNWTANYALLRTFRYSNAFPLGDAGINNAVKKHLKLNRKPTNDEVIRFFRKYKGWEAYATLYLWKGL